MFYGSILCLLLSCNHLIAAAKGNVFWQITDIHLELHYSASGDVNNDCRGNKAKKALGLFGDFNCDSNFLLLQDSVNAMRRIHPKPDFILWTGDNVPHLDDKEINWNLIFSSINTTTSVITDVFHDTLVIPVLGNHDVHPYKHYPWITFDEYCEKYLTIGGWGHLIPVDQHENWRKGAYYAIEVNSQLTILVVNTFIYQFYEKEMGEDPKGQFAWLIDQLQKAFENNKKVIITSHIPPGYQAYEDPFLVSPYVDNYLAIVNEYSPIILAQVYAHLHRDAFRLLRDSSDNFKSHAFLGPSVTPWKYPRISKVGNNPSIRLYNYSLTCNEIIDYQQYSLNFTLANEMAAKGKWPPGEWNLMYKAAQLYNVPNLNLSSVIQIYEQLKNNETVFDAYLKNYFSGFDIGCDANCRKWQLCAIVSVTPEQVDKTCKDVKLKKVKQV